MAAISDFRSGFPSISCNLADGKKTEKGLRKEGYYILDINTQGSTVDFRYCNLRQEFLCLERELENAIHYFNERGITITKGIPCSITKTFKLSLEIAGNILP